MTTLINYPSPVLPYPQISAFAYQEKNRFLTTEMENGATVKRKRNENVPCIFNVEFLMSQAQASYFQAWYRGTLSSGLNWFNLTLNVGAGNLNHECRFISEPQYAFVSDITRVTCDIEAVELQVGIEYDEATLGLIQSLGGLEKASTYFDTLNYQINTLYPDSGYGPGA